MGERAGERAGDDFLTLFEDRHLRVIDKPVGVPVIPRRGGETGEPEDGEGQAGESSVAARTGLMICHRLDQGTSGCLVLGRTAAGHRLINAAFAEGRVGKQYLAVVSAAGLAVGDMGEIDRAIGPWRRGRVAVAPGAAAGGEYKAARTRYRVLWRAGAWAGVLAEPLTGRTHQIRAHLAAIGAPLCGDPLYGGAVSGAPSGGGWGRLMLHAWRIALPWPRPQDRRVVTAALPAGWEELGGGWGLSEVGWLGEGDKKK